MNNICATATYLGDEVTERGLRTLKLEIPGTGTRPITIPLSLLPSFAAGDTCVAGAFQAGATLLVNGRLYPDKETGKMFVVPNQPLHAVNKGGLINQVFLAGGVGFIGEQRREDAFNFGLMCQAPPQKSIGHTWQDSLGFRIESWKDDAERMKKFLFVGRQIAIGGALKFESWTGKDGVARANYKVRIRANQYSFFGKNKKTEELEQKIDEVVQKIKTDKTQAIAKSVEPSKVDDDDIPF